MVIPIKSFDLAKQRLTDVLSGAERKDLAEKLAIGVIRSASPLPVVVVCHDAAVADVALGLGAEIVDDGRLGLNNAVHVGHEFVRQCGGTRIVVIHADIPLKGNLSARLRTNMLTSADVLLVPDRRLDGTNVLSVPVDAGFQFHYGHASFGQHRNEATRCGLRILERRDHMLALDIDTADDLREWNRRME